MNQAVETSLRSASESIDEALRHLEGAGDRYRTLPSVYYAIQSLAQACKHLEDAVRKVSDV